ncbi:MAG: imidazolonepropionase [Owenweeksia sp.]|nr:imidazolonepropionase [Owenweeksia sp.]MBG00402.1 imidazolonepropionase [Owenweeksia sp.]|tara:strand:- start:1078 stop:2313 length:1236 start_codon:yes stop_codon:yes gene_type:complete
MSTLITNISALLHIDLQGRKWKRGRELGEFPISRNAWLLLEDDIIKDFGNMEEGLPENFDEKMDAGGGMILPTWVDSHTHLVYAGTREDEFSQRLHGLSYAEIAARGGGILNSVKKLRQASEDELYDVAAARLEEVMQLGTGAIEIKSGYGLNTESEIKMLKVARRLGENYPLPVKTTFLGAHAFPEKFKDDHQGYVRLISEEMLPEIAAQNLADYVDVFCEEGYFSVDEMLQILEVAQKLNIKSKLHLNQFNSLDSIEKATQHDALSVDHLEVMSEKDKQLLGKSDTVATLLPGCSLFLEIPFAPARDLIQQNAIVALATDYNPGSAPSGNMNLMVSLACIKMKMTPEEAISAATLNGAAALELSDRIGSIEKGKKANFILTPPLSSPSFIPYNFGHNHVQKVFINGKAI